MGNQFHLLAFSKFDLFILIISTKGLNKANIYEHMKIFNDKIFINYCTGSYHF